MTDYLTTCEVAALLRIKERKVYDLAASGELPHSKAIGKLLFPRDRIEAWLAGNVAEKYDPDVRRQPIVLGSHDPLLDWALRESRSGIATLFDSSHDGLARYVTGTGIAAGIHIPDGKGAWNIEAVKTALPHEHCVLMHWARRQRGLVLNRKTAGRLKRLKELSGLRFIPRQPEAGSQIAFEGLLREAGLNAGAINMLPPARSENEIVEAVASGNADAGFALEALIQDRDVGFLPLLQECYDLVVDRFSWFEPPFQRFLEFTREPTFEKKADAMLGYDVSHTGKIRLNPRY